MKRDMDLIRKILFEIEKWPLNGGGSNLEIQEYSTEEVTYHVMLLVEAGLIKAYDVSSMSGPAFIPERLTWQGHEFLDAARDDNRWNKAKDAMGKAGGFVFEVAKALLISYLSNQVMPPKP